MKLFCFKLPALGSAKRKEWHIPKTKMISATKSKTSRNALFLGNWNFLLFEVGDTFQFMLV